mmetsp:Transcript_17585/g.46815  ORF Transcript_17585/g.46815 Transcript_17585/m.46815 type:complete len:300 (-) Transcript_17585:311-1210(-)
MCVPRVHQCKRTCHALGGEAEGPSGVQHDSVRPVRHSRHHLRDVQRARPAVLHAVVGNGAAAAEVEEDDAPHNATDDGKNVEDVVHLQPRVVDADADEPAAVGRNLYQPAALARLPAAVPSTVKADVERGVQERLVTKGVRRYVVHHHVGAEAGYKVRLRAGGGNEACSRRLQELDQTRAHAARTSQHQHPQPGHVASVAQRDERVTSAAHQRGAVHGGHARRQLRGAQRVHHVVLCQRPARAGPVLKRGNQAVAHLETAGSRGVHADDDSGEVAPRDPGESLLAQPVHVPRNCAHVAR